MRPVTETKILIAIMICMLGLIGCLGGLLYIAHQPRLISIYDLQKLLIAEGCQIEVDGLIGPQTIEAYRKWDREFGIERIK